MREKGDFRDTLYTIDKSGRRKWIYSHYLPGRFLRTRATAAYILIAFYISLPWLSIDGKQGVLLDFPKRRFIFFGFEFWATDTIFLFLVLAMLGMALFFFTAVIGRVWCGWACPETVFLEYVFRPIERLIEGSDSARRRLDAAPWTLAKIIKKSLKHLFCAVVSWTLASTALAYFIGREALIQMMTQSPFLNLGPFLMTLALMAVMAFQFGWFREQFCTVLCPYARFQSVLMDQHSLLIGYDRKRGEPRGKLRARATEGTGDCIDCGMCVRVCPTGIDIRNGTQLECIACAACVDACDSIMTEINRPRGLVRYDTEAGLLGGGRSIIRPRIFVYGAIFLALFSVFLYQLSHRELAEVELVRMASQGGLVQAEGEMISNQFSLHLANKAKTPLKFSIEVATNIKISMVSPLASMEVKAGDAVQVPVFFRAPRSAFRDGKARIDVIISNNLGGRVNRTITLFGPE